MASNCEDEARGLTERKRDEEKRKLRRTWRRDTAERRARGGGRGVVGPPRQGALLPPEPLKL